jgi:flagellar hook-associated protein 3 FlgL
MIDMTKNMIYHIGNLNAQSERISYQMASGKAIDKGSDDAVLHANLINLEDKLRVQEGLSLQITKSQALNNTADSSIGEVKSSLESIKLDIMKALNDGMDRSDKLALATNINGIRENIIDRVNTEIDGEYIFSGSVTTNPTLEKDPDFDTNGKIEYGGDGFLRSIAVQPSSYRDRGVTAYDVVFNNYDAYDRKDEKSNPLEWDGLAIAGEQLVYESGDRIIDNDGYEWKHSEDNKKLQRYDHNGDLVYPLDELDLFMTPEKQIRVDLGMGANADASGNYTIEIDGNVYTTTGADASTLFTNFKALIEADGYTVDSSLHNGDKFYIYSETDMIWDYSDTDPKYSLGVSNEIEADGNTQGRPATWRVDVPVDPENRVFEAKHNYFTELNKIINTLEGYVTKLDGTKGPMVPKNNEGFIDTMMKDGLQQTTNQFDASNIGHGELGGRNAVFDIAQTKIEAQITHYNILIQEYGGADLAKLAMESKSLELTYQSLYTTISKMNQLSLVNFIK